MFQTNDLYVLGWLHHRGASSPPKPCFLEGIRPLVSPPWISSYVSQTWYTSNLPYYMLIITMAIVHVCTMAIVRACIMTIVHACTTRMVQVRYNKVQYGRPTEHKIDFARRLAVVSYSNIKSLPRTNSCSIFSWRGGPTRVDGQRIVTLEG